MRPNGTAIREFRGLKNMSLRVLASQTGRDRSHLSRLERGIAGASDETVKRIATALGVPIAAITYDPHKEKT